MVIIAPSLLAANWNKIDDEIKQIKHPNVKWIHFDIMDGHFVPNKTYSPNQLLNLSTKHKYYWDVHLMVKDPLNQATEFAKAGANLITFHFEATNDCQKIINHIKSLKCDVGISIKPLTDVKVLLPFLNQINVVLVMSVEPGKGGQKFIPNALEKIKFLKNQQNNNNFLIEVDGGVKDFNSNQIIQAGANVLVAGSYIFKSLDYYKQITKLLT